MSFQQNHTNDVKYAGAGYTHRRGFSSSDVTYEKGSDFAVRQGVVEKFKHHHTPSPGSNMNRDTSQYLVKSTPIPEESSGDTFFSEYYHHQSINTPHIGLQNIPHLMSSMGNLALTPTLRTISQISNSSNQSRFSASCSEAYSYSCINQEGPNSTKYLPQREFYPIDQPFCSENYNLKSRSGHLSPTNQTVKSDPTLLGPLYEQTSFSTQNQKHIPFNLSPQTTHSHQYEHFKPCVEYRDKQMGTSPSSSSSFTPEIFRDITPHFENSHIFASPSSIVLPTVTSIPSNKVSRNEVKLPFGVILSPSKEHPNIPVYAPSFIQRCKNCRTYLNPYVKWISTELYICNICFQECKFCTDACVNAVSGEIYPLNQLFSLNYSSYEMVGTSVFNAKPPEALFYVFLLDVSHDALSTNYLEVVCQALEESLSSMSCDSRTRFSVICFDQHVHLYLFDESSESNKLRHVVVTDSEEPFLPSPDSLFLFLKKDSSKIVNILKVLPQIHRAESSLSNDSCLGSVLNRVFGIISSDVLKITIFYRNAPSIGEGKFQSPSSDHEINSQKLLFVPTHNFYKNLGVKTMTDQISVSLFSLAGSGGSALKTLGSIAKYTGGDIYHYNYSIQITNGQFYRELTNYLRRSIGLHSIIKIRHGPMLALEKFVTHVPMYQQKQICLPCIHSDLSLGILLKILDAKRTTQTHEFLQVTVFYTHINGEKRIRVHNIPFKLESSSQAIYHTANDQAISTLIAKMLIDFTMDCNLSQTKDALIQTCRSIIQSYRQFVPSEASRFNGSDVSSLLPRNLFNLPSYFHGVIRLCGRKHQTLDSFYSLLYNLMNCPIDMAMAIIYPRLIMLDDILCFEKHFDLPLQPCSAKSLMKETFILLDAGTQLFLFCDVTNRSDISSRVIGPLLESGSQMFNLPDINTFENKKLTQLISLLIQNRPIQPSLLIISPSHPNSCKPFYELLILDRFDDSEAFTTFISSIMHSN